MGKGFVVRRGLFLWGGVVVLWRYAGFGSWNAIGFEVAWLEIIRKMD